MIKKVTVDERLWIEMYSMTQEERTNYICSSLEEMDIPFVRHNGNIYSIRNSNEPVFVAHLDTVNDLDMSKRILIDTYQNAIYRDKGILGADDIAGCAIIMNHASDINFALFKDEEIGGIGSREMAVNIDFLKSVEDFNVTCFVELDRMNSSDIIGSNNGYCDIDLEDEISKILPKYNVANGVWTDIDNLKDIRPGVNLSVGYYKQHTSNEFLKIDEFLYIDSMIIALRDGLKKKFNPAPEDKYASMFNGCYTKWASSPKLTDVMITFLESKYGLLREDIKMLGFDFFDSEGMLDEYYIWEYTEEDNEFDRYYAGTLDSEKWFF